MNKLLKTVRVLLLSFLGLMTFACNQTQPNQTQSNQTQSNQNITVPKDSVTEMISSLFEKALTSDTIEYSNQFEQSFKSFLFFKSGYIINKNKENALVIVCPTDTTYLVRLFAIRENNWQLVDSINGLEAFSPQFSLIFDDYNFDHQTDFYIQVSVSNGWPLSRGHLITLDSKTQKFTLHPEARNLANITTDPQTQVIKSELWNGYDLIGRHQVKVITNKWVNGQLKTINQRDVTVNSL